MTSKLIAVAIVLGCVVTTATSVGQEKAKATKQRPYFSFDAESHKDGEALPQPPFFPQPWKEASANHPKRGKVVADPTAPQGKNVLRWDVTQARTTELYHEVKFDRLPEAKPKDYFYAFFVRYDRIDGKDIWHTGKDESSADKGFEIKGDGIRWIVSFGSWGHSNAKQRFTTWVGNPTYHVNRKLEVYDAYYPNQNGYSQEKPVPLEYEKWHAFVFKMRWATDDTGAIALWVNGIKSLEYTGI